MENIKTFSKNININFDNDEYQDQNQNQNDIDEDNSEYEQELLDFEYHEKTINIIYNEFSNYLESKSLPICEYLDIKTIKTFINKNLNIEN